MPPVPLPLESGGSTAPLDGAGTSAMGGQMGTISLGMLIQYINQRTYSDLLNLAETLPRKGDHEKKIEIVQFAQRTRQLYVRLLALVKWAASASKVDKCCLITNFLEKQNGLILDTADKLFHMTKENLGNARLPHFHIPAAVEIFTTCSYERLPLTIRQRILPPEPITSSERRQTLVRLEQIVQHRLMSTELPPQMRTSKIENGRIRFTVDHEFEVSLTLMSDSASEPWRLLEVDVLVEDMETGEGKALVHPLQLNYIHQLIQSRLHDNSNPLLEVYSVLHSFCQSLQLEVLYAQTLKLLDDRLDFHIRIEEYLQGKSLTITYWRELVNRDPSTILGYRLTVEVDTSQLSRPLMLIHTPSLGSKEVEVSERALHCNHLSIERLLMHTIHLRTKVRLSELKQEIDQKLGKEAEKCQLRGSPSILHIPILQPCFPSEQLLIAVDTHTGMMLCHVPQYDNFSRVQELNNCFNGDNAKLDELISELRFWIMVRRTEKTLQHLDADAHERLPLMYDSAHPLHTLTKHKIYITFHRHPTYALVVEFHERTDMCCEIEIKMYLLTVKEASIEDDPDDDSIQTSLPKSYLRAYKLMTLDAFICTHGPTTSIDVLDPSDASAVGMKRKTPPTSGLKAVESKKMKVPAYFLRDISQVVAMCDQVFPLSHVAHELHSLDIRTSGVQVDEGGMGLCLRLVDMLNTKDLLPSTMSSLYKHLLSVTLRTTVMLTFNAPQQYKSNKSLVVEYVFTNCPLQSLSPREQGSRRPVTFTYEAPGPESTPSTVQALISDWLSIAKLYEIMIPFAQCYNALNDPTSSSQSANCVANASNCLKQGDRQMVKVRSLNYKSISLAYGPNYNASVTVRYNVDKKIYNLVFGMVGQGVWSTNPHTLLLPHLEDLINRRGDQGLISLSFLLHNTYQPLLALSKLQPTLHPGAIDKCQHPIQIFSLVPHSCTRIHIFYRNVYCLEVDFLANGLVSVRDGAFSLFVNSRAIEDFTPIKGFKAFLSKYVDESAIIRRRSQSEDDNPPTPIPLEDAPSWATPKSTSPARHGPITPPARHGPITPPVSSNPHTPSSPHPGGVSSTSHGTFGSSPAAAFSLSSPPSHPSMNPSPNISHPSPSYMSHSPGAGGNPSPGFMAAPSPVGHSLTQHSPAAAAYAQGQLPSWQVSRILPNRPYAAAIPTLITHDAFHTLCSPPQVQESNPNPGRCCLLEQFLGSTYIYKCLQQYVRNSDLSLAPKDANSSQLKMESLIATFILECNPIHCLSLKVQPTPEFTDRWTLEEVQSLERLFITKASSAPYKTQAIEAFFKLLCFPPKLLKDIVRLIHMEMFPTSSHPPLVKWTLNWCLTVPALGLGRTLLPPGQCAVYCAKVKYLFYIQLTHTTQLPNESEPTVLVLPVIHDLSVNKTQVGKRGDNSLNDPSDRIIHAINELMNRVPSSSVGMQNNPQQEPCSIYPCIRELILNFNLSGDVIPTVVSNMPNQVSSGMLLNTQQQQPPTAPMSSISSSMTGSHMPTVTQQQQPSIISQSNITTSTIGGPSYNVTQGPGPTPASGPNQHMQPGGIGSHMGMMPHGNMGQQGMMQQAGRGSMSNMGMQPGMPGGQQGFGRGMMGQFPR